MLILYCLEENNIDILNDIPDFVEMQNVSYLSPSAINSFQPDAVITQSSRFSLNELNGLDGLMDSSRILLMGNRKDSHNSIAEMAHRGIFYCQDIGKERIKNFLLSCCKSNDFPKYTDIDDLGLIGSSSGIREIRKKIIRFAPLDDTVIIIGETGSGKDITARALHRCSGRTGSFLPINCSAIPESLIESEIFGSVKGAYTGADKDNSGYLRAAHKGTLFLDEIGDMPIFMQTKLLRVLEDKKVTPLGSTHSHMVDVRIITATSKDIKMLMNRGRFRKDLYYRLNILKISIPALSERKSDIPQLACFFLNQNETAKTISPGAMMKLLDHNWPGNVRELKTVIRRAEILSGNQGLINEGYISFK